MNARAFAIALEGNRPVEESLGAWESAVRFIADNAQRWALRYDLLNTALAGAAWLLRPAILWAFRSIPSIGRRMRIADQGLNSSRGEC